MLGFILSLSPITIFVLIALGWFIYTRAIKMYITRRALAKQGIPTCNGLVPVLGNLFRLGQIMQTQTDLLQPWWHILKQDFGERGTRPGVIAMYNGFEPTLFISDPKILEELYVTKAKFLEKHPMMGRNQSPLTGDTIVFMPGNEQWAKKRKALSASFYKDRLVKMVEIVKDITKHYVD
jgi:cytochrome P450